MFTSKNIKVKNVCFSELHCNINSVRIVGVYRIKAKKLVQYTIIFSGKFIHICSFIYCTIHISRQASFFVGISYIYDTTGLMLGIYSSQDMHMIPFLYTTLCSYSKFKQKLSKEATSRRLR